jgi:hypothetical protein
MASVNWTSPTGGAWNTPGNWSSGAAPVNGDDVTINTPGNSITVTYSTGNLALDSLTTGSGDTLSLTGGTLALANGYQLDGAVTMSGGLFRLAGGNYGNAIQNSVTMSAGILDFVNSASISGGSFSQAGGTMSIDHGLLTDNENSGSLAGTISGAGEIVFATANGGTTILQSGFVLSTGSADIASGTVLLNEALNYGHNFSLFGTLDLNGHAMKLTGNTALDGDVNGGSLTVAGNAHLNNLVLDNGAFLDITSSVNQTGSIQLGGSTGTGTLGIAATGTLRVTGNDSIGQGQSAGYLINAGLLEKTAGNSQSGTTYILDTVTNSGIIDAAVGTIDFRGPSGGAQSTITGTLAGAGTIAFDNGSYLLGSGAALTLASHRLLFAGSTASTNITLASALTYGGNWEQTGGLLLFENNLTLNGISAFDGGELKGTATITDNGALTLESGMDLEGNLSFLLNGPVDQTGGINLGQLSDSVDHATLSAGDSWALEGNASISGAYGTITNNGTFARLDGAQNAVVASTLVNNATLLVESGTLSLTGQGTLGGIVGGAAVLDISGQFALANGLALSVGELILDAPAQTNDVQASLGGDLTYAHDFALEGGTLALNGHTMTLSGIAFFGSGAIQGSGEVLTTGAATIIGLALTQGGVLQFDGATEQAGGVTLTGGSTAPVLSIGTGGVYTMDNAVTIGGANGSVVGTLSVQGTLLAAGPGTATIAASIADTGSIDISHGQMQFLGPLTGTGAITVSAGAILDLDNANSTSTGITFGGGGGLLYLQAPSAYGGTIGDFASGDAVELNGFAFSVNGTQASFTVSGDHVTISEPAGGPSLTLTFSNTQTASSLMLGVGPHGGLDLIHL